LEAKTEVALTTNPQTIAHPTGTADGNWLIWVAAGGVSPSTLVPSAIDRAKYRWTYITLGTGSNLALLVAFKQFRTGDVAPSLGTASTGYSFMYRYSGVTSARYITQTPVAATTQDCPYTSAENGEEIVWVGVGRRTGTPAPGVTFDRGTVETNQNANFLTLTSFREALGGAVNMVQATMAQTGTPAYAGSAAFVVSDKGSHVYKGRDTAADDTTGAA
jgi:hypothetical protein